MAHCGRTHAEHHRGVWHYKHYLSVCKSALAYIFGGDPRTDGDYYQALVSCALDLRKHLVELLRLYRKQNIIALFCQLKRARSSGSSHEAQVLQLVGVLIVGENRRIAKFSVDALDNRAAHIANADKSQFCHCKSLS